MYIYIYIQRNQTYQQVNLLCRNFFGPCASGTVSFHNLKSQNFKLSVSNPKSKYAAYLSVLSQISNCQGLGRKNKHTILKTDRTSPRSWEAPDPLQDATLSSVIYLYIYLYVCRGVCTYMHMYVYIYIYTHTYTNIYTLIFVGKGASESQRVLLGSGRLFTYVYVYVSLSLSIYIYIYIYICIYIYIYVSFVSQTPALTLCENWPSCCFQAFLGRVGFLGTRRRSRGPAPAEGDDLISCVNTGVTTWSLTRVARGRSGSMTERLAEYCWNSAARNLEFDEAVPLCDSPMYQQFQACGRFLSPKVSMRLPTVFGQPLNDEWLSLGDLL